MKKTIPLFAVLGGLLICASLVWGEWQRRQQMDRQQAAHLLSSCVNQGLLSLFRLQRNDWGTKPDFHRQEEISLQVAVAELPEKILDTEPGRRAVEAEQLCASMTENSIRQHGTIYGPLGDLAQDGVLDPASLTERKASKRQQRKIRRLRVSAQAADRYLEDLRVDLSAKLAASALDSKTRQLVEMEIQREVLDYYQPGNFSRDSIEHYLSRREKLIQLLADNPDGYSIRSGALYFHNAGLRRRVDSLYRALLQGHGKFLANWKQVVRHQQRPLSTSQGV
ncbi:hypothetical protein AWR36_011045 [Microbulbifer flavimaris]|uniref:DUF3826 domain-containing protein n=1 Tax=Microbulbifer flavimaris TaxID=1781068 RepID=A0ABX4HYU6_9GAMM|nr:MULTISPECIES: hypothetical protein [Microbulbifer]KUJ83065.1 hypothetical protein AVO43_11025 [Microbulbifer sp. ZGT114]PCO05251.1 hypothetical protein AWR36_011045 [Microbulbifer flavimaris]